jgi:tetratricopeptide (TPR) repeat protein
MREKRAVFRLVPRVRSAFTQYRLAAKAEPGYQQRPYFWREIAGILHLLGHFKWAAEAYQIALQTGGENVCLALRADSLMFDGKYRDALKQFGHYMTVESKPDDEWHLKNFMVSHLVDDLGMGEQKRDPSTANRPADITTLDKEEGLNSLREAIRADALSSFAWFNMGAAIGRESASQEAFQAYLFAGVCFPPDVEAWSRALLFGLKLAKNNSLNVPLSICIARFAYRWNGLRFLEQLQKHVGLQPPGFPAADFMGLVADAVKDIDRMKRLTEVRMVGQGSNYKVVLSANKLL